ncbi:MAG TPA: metallophosphoesterase [Nitriliruptorales bacterium]|nr:metallophosphoesterase [Nitriliruptorales bacterium]
MAGVVATLGTACVAYATVVERGWFRLRRERLPGLLRSGAPRALRLLVVSDLHLDPPDPRLEAFVRELPTAEVDLIVAAGDLVGGRGAEDATVGLLATLTTGGTPAVAVLGSNDLYAPRPKNPLRYLTHPDVRTYGPPLDTAGLCAGLRAAGWCVLEDARTTVQTAAGTVEVAGLRDPHLRSPLPPRDQVAARDPTSVLRLGVVHAPYVDALDLLAAAGYDLLVAGHTHGGQVRLPGVGALVTNCDLPTDRARGTSRWHADDRGAWLHVSAGLGQSRYAPFRFACRPEASLLELSLPA